MDDHRLLLSSLEQAKAYLSDRAKDLAGAAEAGIRNTLLKDRAALFWLCKEARCKWGPKTAWAVFSPQGSDPRPRIHSIQGPGTGLPIQRHETLRSTVAFSGSALKEHGALWLPLCLDKRTIDDCFGQGAWFEIMLTHSREQAAHLSEALPCPHLGGAPIARDRL